MVFEEDFRWWPDEAEPCQEAVRQVLGEPPTVKEESADDVHAGEPTAPAKLRDKEVLAAQREIGGQFPSVVMWSNPRKVWVCSKRLPIVCAIPSWPHAWVLATSCG